jgi:hypothetical protein
VRPADTGDAGGPDLGVKPAEGFRENEPVTTTGPVATTGPARTRGSVTTTIQRRAWTLPAGLLGLAVGVIGSFEHRATVTLGGTALPTGLLLSLGGLCGALLLVGELTGVREHGRATARPSRLGTLGLTAAGWLLAVVWLTYVGPPFRFAVKGDVILADDWKSTAFLFGGMALITAGIYRAWTADLTARLAARGSGPAPDRSKE